MPEQMENYTDNQLVSFIQKGNSDAFVELTARYLSFIRAKAHPFRSSVLEADDLCQEGLLGLFSAARSYNPNKDASFKTYAGICIQKRIVPVHAKRTFLWVNWYHSMMKKLLSSIYMVPVKHCLILRLY